MHNIRLSTPADIPALRRLWVLAFGDGGDYLDNFFSRYYAPERMILLEEEGELQAMTAWFDTTLVVSDRGEYRCAYLYAVATHPQCWGRGLAGALLAWADQHFRTLSIPAVSTVPAEPSLHNFFAANGFRECFAYHQLTLSPSPCPPPPFALEPVSPEAYGRLREQLLADLPHIAYPVDAISYQQGCCAISGGGLYTAETSFGRVLLCAEGMEDGRLLLKELLGQPTACDEVCKYLFALLPSFSGICRLPGKGVPFGMLKWLEKNQQHQWNWDSTAYLGLAFD